MNTKQAFEHFLKTVKFDPKKETDKYNLFRMWRSRHKAGKLPEHKQEKILLEHGFLLKKSIDWKAPI